ncbi:hypothetical protein [Streptomyces sp. NPDC090025]|uniref:DUF7224 domain-containing protein n=1 Tax=Streptomyces sp. NPDC090025 TaxID=3365922 RepID=UPI0038361827
MVSRNVRIAAEKLRTAGIQTPRTLTMAAHPGPDASKLDIAPDAQAADIPGGVASGLLPEPPSCALNGEPYPAAAAAGPLTAWLYATAGVPSGTVAGDFATEEAALVEQVRALPAGKQLAWYQRNRKAMTVCGTPPRLGVTGVTGAAG